MWANSRGLAVAAAFACTALGATHALAQSPPSLQEYPLRDRILGPGGAVFPDYVTPSEGGTSFLTGRGTAKGAIFAAGTTDYNCQQTEVPTITVLSAPARGKVKVGYGSFVATGIDGGALGYAGGGATTKCLGQTLKGTVVSFKGRAAPGETVTLRVTYPTLGAWYDHVVPVR